MASYCTHSQVGALLNKGSFSATSTPTQTQVEDIIDQITNEIDTVLSTIGINSQPTDTKLLGVLEKNCSFGSAGIVGITYLRNNEGFDKSSAAWFYSKYETFLKMLVEKPEMFGIIADSETLYANNQVEDGTYTEDEYNDMFIDETSFKFI